MNDAPPPAPDDGSPDHVAADDLLASRALDGDLTADEQAAVESDPRHRGRRDAMESVRHWIADVPVGVDATAAAVSFAMATHDRDTGRDTDRDTASRAHRPGRRRRDRHRVDHRLPVWLGAAAGVMVVVGGSIVLTRGADDREQPMADDIAVMTSADESASAKPAGTERAAVDAANAQTVVTVNLDSNDPRTNPFPMPDDDEIVQMRSAAEVAWLGRWAVPKNGDVSRCREGALVLLTEALWGAQSTTARLVEIVLDAPVRTVAAYALDDCAELATVALD